MKVTLSKIHAIDRNGQSSVHPSLVKLGADELLPRKTRYWLGRLLDMAVSEIKTIEKHRGEIVKKYAGDQPRVPDDKLEAFHAEFNELLEVEIDLPDLSIPFEDIDEKSPLTGIDFMALDWIIAPPKDEPVAAEKAAAATGD